MSPNTHVSTARNSVVAETLKTDMYPVENSHEASKCHGRISDLEMMVPPQWWKTVFADGLYLKTDGDVIEDPEITQEEIALLESEEVINRIFQRGKSVSPCKIIPFY